MRRRRNPFGDDGGHGHGGLQITPLLDLFVALIPFLILSAAMSKINVVDVKVSKPVAIIKKPEGDKFSLVLKVKNEKIKVLLNKKDHLNIEVKDLKDKSWQEKLHASLIEIKKNNPNEFELKIEPEEKVELEYLMAIMDHSRKLNSKDEEIIRKDKKTGKNIKVKYLFPKVTLRGVYS